MSRSIHITIKNFKGLSKRELKEQKEDPNSDIAQWAKKKNIKGQMKKSRKKKLGDK
jgi:hypothetical protein